MTDESSASAVETFEPPSTAQVESAMTQLEDSQKVLDYDTKEFTIELLTTKFGTGSSDNDIFVPSYQRAFNWDERRQSRFIESLLIGLPIPFLFFADLEDGKLEVVDGRQRLGTCAAFLANDLVLEGLDRLTALEGFRFCDLSMAQQRRFKNRSVRSVVLSQKASEEDRRDLFDRINTGSLIAEPVEVRRGAVKGPLTDLIDQLANDTLFMRLCPLTKGLFKRREGEELITRFFAFGDGFDDDFRTYNDRPREFLMEWMTKANGRAVADPHVLQQYRDKFTSTMQFVSLFFPNGFAKNSRATTTPRVRFDALAVGVNKALVEAPELLETGPDPAVDQWLSGPEFFVLTTSSAANVKSRMLRRIKYVKYMLLGKSTLADLQVDPTKGAAKSA